MKKNTKQHSKISTQFFDAQDSKSLNKFAKEIIQKYASDYRLYRVDYKVHVFGIGLSARVLNM